MNTWNAAEWVPTEQDGLGSRLLIVADGSVLVRIQEQPGSIGHAVARHGPAVFCGIALLLACISVTALGTTYLINRDAAERQSAQTSQLQLSLDNAVAAARQRSDAQMGSLLMRTDDLGQKIEQASQHVDLASKEVLKAVSGSPSTVRNTRDSIATPATLSLTALTGQTGLRFEHADGATSLRDAQTFKSGAAAGVRPLLRPKPRTVDCRTGSEPTGGTPKQGLPGPCVDHVGLHGSPDHEVLEDGFDGESLDIAPHEPAPPREHADGPH